MFRWRFLKQFPKIALAVGVFVVSTGLFGFWWYFKRSQTHKENVVRDDRAKQKVEAVAEVIPSMEGNLLVADGDLYQLDSGKLLLKNWFKEAMPAKLFLDAENGKLIARYGKGLVRLNLDGKRDASLGGQYGLFINSAMDTAVYAKDKDVWKATINLREFKLVDEQRVTTTAGFMERFFVDNILLATSKVLVVRNNNQLLRIDLVTGEVISTKVPLSGLKNQRSPDGALVVGGATERRVQKLFVYDVEKDEAKYFDMDFRMKVTEFAWVNRNTCAYLVAGVALGVYDREKQEIRQLMRLPIQCSEMINPSPTGHYVFCGSLNARVLVNIEGKKIEPLGTPAQHYEWIADDVLLCARDVPDSNLRGTWVKQIGKEEVRVSTEPYTFASRGGGSSVLSIKEAGIVFFSTRGGMFKMKLGETEAQMFAPLAKPLTRFVYIEKWEKVTGIL
ncbi:MAG: hypothetical protein JNM99_14830 [Verrucomicrobiaceae bacterium]|nr:hypothetical protein [Verrucomicrobiaceae bacterium]